jgi:hypothetical protein
LVNFYRCLLLGLAGLLQSKRLLWTEATGAAFLTIKTALAAALLLAHLIAIHYAGFGKGCLQYATRAILKQKGGAGWWPFTFFCKKSALPQTCYSTFEREPLAAYNAVRHFQFLVEGRQFTLLTAISHRFLACIDSSANIFLWLISQLILSTLLVLPIALPMPGATPAGHRSALLPLHHL